MCGKTFKHDLRFIILTGYYNSFVLSTSTALKEVFQKWFNVNYMEPRDSFGAITLTYIASHLFLLLQKRESFLLIFTEDTRIIVNVEHVSLCIIILQKCNYLFRAQQSQRL